MQQLEKFDQLSSDELYAEEPAPSSMQREDDVVKEGSDERLVVR